MPDPPAEINMSHIQVSGGATGFVFAGGTAYIFLVGIPAVRWFFVGAVVTGAVISIALSLFHKYRPARPFSAITN